MCALVYSKEIPEATYIRRRENDPEYSQLKDPDFQRMILFEDGKQVSGDMKFPQGEVKAALPDNRILVKIINSEVEEDVIRYEIYQLVRK